MTPDDTIPDVSPRDVVYQSRSTERKTIPSSFAIDEAHDDFDMTGQEETRLSPGKRIVAVVRKAKTRKIKYLVRNAPPSHHTEANVSVNIKGTHP